MTSTEEQDAESDSRSESQTVQGEPSETENLRSYETPNPGSPGFPRGMPQAPKQESSSAPSPARPLPYPMARPPYPPRDPPAHSTWSEKTRGTSQHISQQAAFPSLQQHTVMSDQQEMTAASPQVPYLAVPPPSLPPADRTRQPGLSRPVNGAHLQPAIYQSDERKPLDREELKDRVYQHIKTLIERGPGQGPPCNGVEHLEHVMYLARNILKYKEGLHRCCQIIADLACILHHLCFHPAYATLCERKTLTYLTLMAQGAAQDLAHYVSQIVRLIMRRGQISNRVCALGMAKAVALLPELPIVSDAIRLGWLGAHGIALTFANPSLWGTTPNFESISGEAASGMMQFNVDNLSFMNWRQTPFLTERGTQLAGDRIRRIEAFCRWWQDEKGELDNETRQTGSG